MLVNREIPLKPNVMWSYEVFEYESGIYTLNSFNQNIGFMGISINFQWKFSQYFEMEIYVSCAVFSIKTGWFSSTGTTNTNKGCFWKKTKVPPHFDKIFKVKKSNKGLIKMS
jgi:hypothetical protein